MTKTQITRATYYIQNKERIIAYRKKYHEEHREKILKKVRDHYHANRDKRLAYGKKWREANADKMRVYKDKSNEKLRNAVFDAYGGPICVCCKESQWQFLNIDHIDGDGNTHRKSTGIRGGKDFYRWLRKNGFPPGFQVLCYNCNMSKGAYGACPHQMPQSTVSPL